ncbi:histidine phosphatase family protein [Limnobacter sp.]|uniref:histidine phosphatase family protein n=1 Tax=Limnobacter sp. TaxID=2003368 RepID=UPI0027BB1E21|nr:histidine phosphatase family protein [Limnobacter sp.]
MSTLILMRHGQASFGAARYDALSELGQAQARATGLWLRNQGLQPNVVLHGPRQRQAGTAALLLKESGFGIPSHQHTALDEFAEGEEIFSAAEQLLGRSMALDAGRSRLDVLHDYDATCRAWANGEVTIPGRLSLKDFRAQLSQWLSAHTHAQQASGQVELVVTSAGSIAALMCEVMGLPDSSWYSLLRVIRNASLTEVLYSKGKVSLLSFNGVSHLPPQLNTSM